MVNPNGMASSLTSVRGLHGAFCLTSPSSRCSRSCLRVVVAAAAAVVLVLLFFPPGAVHSSFGQSGAPVLSRPGSPTHPLAQFPSSRPVALPFSSSSTRLTGLDRSTRRQTADLALALTLAFSIALADSARRYRLTDIYRTISTVLRTSQTPDD